MQQPRTASWNGAPEASGGGTLGVATGTALYVGSLIGPGVLLVPSLAAQAAGPASVISWGALLVLSVPLAILFAVLGIRTPVSGGVAEYVRVGFGRRAGLVTGGWFLTAVLLGAPTVAMIGGLYVADLTSVPLADLMTVGLGQAGRKAATVLAVALTMATMNVYIASAARLASALAASVVLPAWLGRDEHLTVPRRPLLVIGSVGMAMLVALALGVIRTSVIVRATSACFVAVYVAATASGVRILRGRIRWAVIPTVGS